MSYTEVMDGIHAIVIEGSNSAELENIGAWKSNSGNYILEDVEIDPEKPRVDFVFENTANNSWYITEDCRNAIGKIEKKITKKNYSF